VAKITLAMVATVSASVGSSGAGTAGTEGAGHGTSDRKRGTSSEPRVPHKKQRCEEHGAVADMSVSTTGNTSVVPAGQRLQDWLATMFKKLRTCERRSCRGDSVADDFCQLPDVDVSVPMRRVLYLMRGPPGCGKSTAARKLLARHLSAQGVQWDSGLQGGGAFTPLVRALILSTDDYFTQVDDVGVAEYNFDPRAIRDNHQRNQARCEAAMELSLTPLFIDNTNIALWEMQAYVKLGDRFGYIVKVVNPGALDINKLAIRSSSGRNRPVGKDIGRHVLQRMVQNFEDLPTSDDVSVLDPLDLVRAARSPFEKSAHPAPARYAGLDVESNALAALGAIELGPLFWGERGRGGHYLDARCMGDFRGALAPTGPSDGPFELPARLHLTVRFFGHKPDRRLVRTAEEMVGSLYSVTVRALVFVRGGGLLCAVCDVCGDGGDVRELEELAPDGWRPHITLLTAKGDTWRAVDSTAILEAFEDATSCRQASCVDSSLSHMHLENEPTEHARTEVSESKMPLSNAPNQNEQALCDVELLECDTPAEQILAGVAPSGREVLPADVAPSTTCTSSCIGESFAHDSTSHETQADVDIRVRPPEDSDHELELPDFRPPVLEVSDAQVMTGDVLLHGGSPPVVDQPALEPELGEQGSQTCASTSEEPKAEEDHVAPSQGEVLSATTAHRDSFSFEGLLDHAPDAQIVMRDAPSFNVSTHGEANATALGSCDGSVADRTALEPELDEHGPPTCTSTSEGSKAQAAHVVVDQGLVLSSTPAHRDSLSPEGLTDHASNVQTTMGDTLSLQVSLHGEATATALASCERSVADRTALETELGEQVPRTFASTSQGSKMGAAHAVVDQGLVVSPTPAHRDLMSLDRVRDDTSGMPISPMPDDMIAEDETHMAVSAGIEILHAVPVGDQVVDLCAIHLRPHCELGACPFRLFWM